MQEANIAVPLLPPNEKAPRSGGPVGRLRRILNGIATKFRPDGSLRIEKRPGFASLSQQVNNVASGSLIDSHGVPGPTLMGTLGDELVTIGRGIPHVYAPSPVAARQERFEDTLVVTETARREVVHADTESIDIPDEAAIGNVICYTWRQAGACWVSFIDAVTRTPIRAPFQIASAGRIRVVADGVRFWVFRDVGTTTITVYAFDTGGLDLGVASALTLGETFYPWDVTAMPGAGNGAVIVAHTAPGVSYLDLGFITWTGSAIAVTEVFNSHVNTSYGVGWLRNDTDPNHIYLAVSTQFADALATPPYTYGVYAARLNLDGTLAERYTVQAMTQPEAAAICSLTGYVIPGTQDIRVSYSSMASTGGVPGPFHNNFTTTVTVPSGGSAGATTVNRSLSLASRAFLLGTRCVALAYYASVVGIALFNAQSSVGQPTYFLLDLETGDRVGRLEHGTASMDWLVAGASVGGAGPNFFWLPSPVTVGSEVRVPAGFAADLAVVWTMPDDVNPVRTITPQVGLMDIVLGAATMPVEYASELLIPGPMAVSFTGDEFRASGIELFPEQPIANQTSITDGQFLVGETYSYILVWTRLNSDGRRVRSGASIAVSTVITAGHNAIALTIPTLRVTQHDDVLLEVYRTVWDVGTGTQGTSFRKISVDTATAGPPARAPIPNNPTVDTITWVDTVSNAAAAVGAEVYTENGTLDFAPCPAFSCGAVFGGRVVVSGYDARVWYSFPQEAGKALAFNEDLFYFTMPTAQRVRALVPVDNRLIIGCERSFWFVDGGFGFSNDGESGSNPTPIQLPLTNGCTAFAVLIEDGVIYESTAGGIWLLTRGLQNVFIGAPVEDETAGATVIGTAVDEQQRVHFFLSTSKEVVYDQVARCWYVWALPSVPLAACTWRGQAVYADNGVGGGFPLVRWVTPGTYADGTAPIATRVDVADISLADITGFQVIWEAQAQGEYIGPHTLNVDVRYDNSDDIDETFSEAFTSEVDPYRLEWQPRNTECSAIGVSIYDSFPTGTPSGGFALEAIGLYVGIERGAKYGNRRLAPAE